MEFELYSKGMRTFFEKQLNLRKFSNIGVSRSILAETNGQLEALDFHILYPKLQSLAYNSISFQDYLDRKNSRNHNLVIENEIKRALKSQNRFLLQGWLNTEKSSEWSEND